MGILRVAHFLPRLSLLALLIFGPASAALADKRVALVIGISAYDTVPALRNPVRDAQAVAAALREAGFAVRDYYDLPKAKFDAALKAFGDEAPGADWALVYFAGHGIGIGGETYLLPRDAELARVEHVDFEAIPLARVRAMAAGASALRLVLLDSCRNNPFAARMKADGSKRAVIPRGLGRPSEPEGGELIAYATREQDVADDGEGEHSPFTTALLAELQKPGVEVGFFFRRVRSDVLAATKKAQDPALYMSLSADPFYFRPPVAEPPLAAAPAPRPEQQATLTPPSASHFAPATPEPDAAPLTYEEKAQRLVRRFVGHTHSVYSAAFSMDGRFALSGSGDITLKLWEIATGLEVRTFAGHTNGITSVAFSTDGRFALSGSADNSLKLWEIATGREVRTFAGHKYWVNSIAFSPDGRFALSGSWDKTLKLWQIATGREVRTFAGHTSWVMSVAFSPDGRFALSGSEDKTLKLWEIATGREVRTFAGHTSSVYSVAFSPDGRFALSGSEDKTLKLWEIATGREVRTFPGHTNTVTSVVFSPDGRFALSGSWDNTLKLWDVSEWTGPQAQAARR